MKNKRQLKAEKSQRLAKTVAKKVAAENSSAATSKSRKQSQIEEAITDEYNERSKKVKLNKQTKLVKAEKDYTQTVTDRITKKKDSGGTGTASETRKMHVAPPSYEEPPVQDLQRYLETLPSPEIRHFIEGLIVQDKFNMLTIDVAAAIGDMDRMRYYFQRDPKTGKSRYDPNGRCLDGGTPLHAAIKAKHKDSVQLLIENGADLSLVDFMGDNAIMAAIKAGVAHMINILWPYKANLDVNHENTMGRTALHLAAERSWEGCVRFLLSNHAFPDAKDRDHITPLMIACKKGDLKIVDSLIKAGADIGLEDMDFNTAVSTAIYKRHRQVVDHMLKSLDANRREVYVKDLVYNIMNPPLPEPEYALLEAQYIPNLTECTKHAEFRDSFNNQRVVETLIVRMRHKAKQYETLTQISSLLMNIFFCFGNEIDQQFVRQFYSSGAPKFILSSVMVEYSEYEVRNRLILFFPMISLSEIPEGRSWIWKNVLEMSEFFNNFEKDQLDMYLRTGRTESLLQSGKFKEINRVWVHFYNEVHRMQTEQREKHMMELLLQEELDKNKIERRQEKIKLKKEEKIGKAEGGASLELLESWTCKSITDEDSETEDGLNTCKNTNAVVGSSNEAIADSMVAAGNFVGYINVSSQPQDTLASDVYKWTNTQGKDIQRGFENKWTTVQTKKNKEKERHVPEKQRLPRQSPIQNSKRKKSTIQKQKKKKDTKPMQVPINAFTTQFVAPVLGSTRWADIAKGVVKSTSRIDADGSSFPAPNQAVNAKQTEIIEVGKQTEKFVERDFPHLDSHQMQGDKKEKPNKMTFHFHSEQPDCESNMQCGMLEDDTVDIEQAELELQNYEAYTGIQKVALDENTANERSIRVSQSSECFMCDPEYTDGNKKCVFDPTKLTDEEISSLNTRGKPFATDNTLSSHDGTSYIHESNMRDGTGAIQKEKWNNTMKNTEWMKNIEVANKEERLNDLSEVGQASQNPNKSERLPLISQQRNESSCGAQLQTQKDTSYILRPTFLDQENYQSASIGGSKYIPSNASFQNSQNEITNANADLRNVQYQHINVPNFYSENAGTGTTEQIGHQLHHSSTKPLIGTMHVKEVLSEAERQLLKHQTEKFAEFEDQLELHENEHFMELVVSLSPISEPKPNIIDDLFNTPEEIPEWLNEDEEVPREEDVWDKMTDHSTPIRRLSSIDDKQQFHDKSGAAVSSVNLEVSQTKSAQQQNISPYDLSVTDPAIIRCSKRQGDIDQTNESIAVSVKKEYEKTCAQETRGAPGLDNNFASMNSKVIADVEEINTKDCKDKEMNFNSERQTAVIKPLGLPPCVPTPASNSAFGQQLLENACRLENADKSDDSCLFPGDLDGEAYEADDEQPTTHESANDDFYFPSFHADTMLSAHQNENDISLTHRMQKLQLEQITNYYSRCIDQITDDNSMEQSKFVYYAQAAGMDKQCIDEHLHGRVETGQGQYYKGQYVQQILPSKPSSANHTPVRQSQFQQKAYDQHATYTQTGIQGQNQCVSNEVQVSNIQQPNAQDSNNQYHDIVAPSNTGQGMDQQQQLQLLPVVPYVFLNPYLPPPSHPANIRNIQSQQAAMSSSVRNKIQEIIESMFKAKAKSVRWRNELAKIRNFPPEKLMVVGKVVIPRDDCDRVYIGYHSTGSTILGYLCDGNEVAVKLMDSKMRPIKSDELDKIMNVDNTQPFVNRYRAIEEYNGTYYIAMDLYEYSLPEYIQMLHKDANVDEKIAAEKLVFQLLRGFLTLHQTYLIVHAELRPDNVVIDTDGNLKVSNYGIGRNVERTSEKYSEYSDEDKCWLAPEVLTHKQAITFKMDIFAVGMIIYYIYKGGKNPFGSEPREIIQNICAQNYMMEYISDEAGHLLSMMLSINKIDRPAIADALKHPLFWADEKRLRFVSIVGSDIVWEMKHGVLIDKKQRENSMAAIVSMTPCNLSLVRWIQAIEPVVIKEMKGFRQYKNSLVDLVIFLYNCCNHFETLSPKVREVIDEPCRYFLSKFPTLFMTIYRSIKFSNRREKTCYKPFF